MVVHCHNYETLVFLSVFPYKEKTSGNTNEDLQAGIYISIKKNKLLEFLRMLI